MAFTIGALAAKDGTGATITGGLLAADSTGSGPWFLYNGLVDGVAGSNKAAVTVGNALKVDASATTQPVSGTFWQTTQPVSGTVTAAQATAASLNATVVGNGTFAVQAAQSGTWTVQPGNTPNTTPWLAKINDGTNSAAVAAASTAPTATQPALVVTTSPNAFDFGPGTSGTKTQRVIVDGSQFGPLGQTVMASSAPVVIASDQSAIGSIAKPTATANGQTSSRVNAANSTNATSLKAAPGQIGQIDVFNVAGYNVFLKIYNKASAPTVGTDTPVWTIPVQAGAGFSKSFPCGKTLATGIAYAITKLQPDSDTTVVAAGDLTGSIDWI